MLRLLLGDTSFDYGSQRQRAKEAGNVHSRTAVTSSVGESKSMISQRLALWMVNRVDP